MKVQVKAEIAPKTLRKSYTASRDFYKPKKSDVQSAQSQPKSLDHSAWARHLKRTFQVDVSRCTKCQSPMKIMAVLTDEREINRYLDHVAGYQRAPPLEVKLARETIYELLEP